MKNCLDQYSEDISKVLSLQNLLLNLNESNLQSTIETLKESKFLKSQDDLKILIKIIGKLIKYRRKQMHSFFKLTEAIFPTISSHFTKNEILRLFSQKLITLKLYYDKFISNEDIVAFYGIKSPKLFYFYPEIRNFLSKNSIYSENDKECNRYRDIIEYFSEKNDSEICMDNDPRFKVGNIDKLSVLIQEDDIESFQRMTSQNNIDIKTHEIHLTSFESNKSLRDEKIHVIEYAAYHGSLKIFKFLLMNDSTFSNKLLKYAVCGGNNEIIHLSENKLGNIKLNDEEIESILSLTIILHLNELSEYLIENYNIKVNFRELSISIDSENYEFFFNHILESDAEYSDLLDRQEKNEIELEKMAKMSGQLAELAMFAAGNFFSVLLKIIINIRNVDLNCPLYFELRKKKTNPITNPLTYAIQKFNNKNAKFLVSFDSVDPDFHLLENITPFIWACYVGNLEMVEFLSKNKKVDVLQTVDQSGENAIHIATRQCNLEIVKFLVSLNVFDISQKSLKDGTAIQTAARLGYKEIFDFLKWNFVRNGTKISNDLKINDEKYYPSRYCNPFTMAMDFYGNLDEPIQVCLLI